jgi:hypothetical protein
VSTGDRVVTRAWSGRLEADSCALVGHLRTEVPAGHGPLVVDLSLEAGAVVATNRYRANIIPPAEALPRHPLASRR